MGKEVFGRGQYNETAPALIAGAGMGFPWSEGSYDINTAGYVATLTHTFTGSTVLEVIAGTNWATQDVYPLGQSDWDALDYRNHLPGHRQYFTENNPNHILPDMTFARRQRPAEHEGHQHRPGPELPVAGVERYAQLLGEPDAPARQAQPQGRVLLRAHAGGPVRCRATPAPTTSTPTRPIRSTPISAGRTRCSGTSTPTPKNNNNTRSLPRFNQPEFFVQDNWRLNRQFTLDLGVRFSHIGVVYEKDRDIGWFDPAAWNPASGGAAVAAALRQRRVPLHRREPRGASIRSPANSGPVRGSAPSSRGRGTSTTAPSSASELPDTFPSAGIRTAPRLGFGWDVFGDGKTAVRGGFGTSYNRLGDGQYGGFTGVISRTVSLQWTTIDDRFNAPSLENPLGGTVVQEETRPITVHSWSVGVQRELPWRLLADVAYVGNTVRNAFAVNAGQSYTNQLNDPDPRLVANPTPDMIDRTTGNVLPTNLIRPNYPGRGAITQRVFLDELYRNYNAIQLEVRRRLANGSRLGRELHRVGHQAVHRPMTGSGPRRRTRRGTRTRTAAGRTT